MLSGLDASLARLGTDYVDIWFAQAWDPNVPLEETLSALEFAVRTGRARYAGVSNFNGWQTAKAAAVAGFPARGQPVGVFAAAAQAGGGADPGRRGRRAGPDGLGAAGPRCADRQVPRAHSGGFAGGRSRGSPAMWSRTWSSRRPASSKRLPWRRRDWAGRPLDVALSWLLSQHGVATAIVGATDARAAQGDPGFAAGAAAAGNCPGAGRRFQHLGLEPAAQPAGWTGRSAQSSTISRSSSSSTSPSSSSSPPRRRSPQAA